jgi:hypothetical protein
LYEDSDEEEEEEWDLAQYRKETEAERERQEAERIAAINGGVAAVTIEDDRGGHD